MTISEAGKQFVKKHTFFFSQSVYVKKIRVYKIGYCSYIYPNGKFVGPGENIEEPQAEALLNWHLEKESIAVWRRVMDLGLSQNQFDALVSFSLSLNTLEFSHSQVLREVMKDKDNKFIRVCFLMELNGRKKEASHTKLRRQEEAKLYFNSYKPGRWGWDHRKQIKEVV